MSYHQGETKHCHSVRGEEKCLRREGKDGGRETKEVEDRKAQQGMKIDQGFTLKGD